MKIKAAVAEVGRKPRLVEIEDTLESFQGIVGGRIQPFEVLFGSAPTLYVNEVGILDDACPPNRAVFATEEMAEKGYLSQLGSGALEKVVEPGEPYSILFGNILAVAYDVDEDMEWNVRDITQEEFKRFYETFEDPDSGIVLALTLKLGMAER